jgi:sterol desaturase/sphingolipid hydroxylase (fatty acid hydroxylase superfamily)
MDVSLILLLLAPVFLLTCGAEIYYYYKQADKNIYSVKDTLANASLALMYQVSDIICTIIFIKIAYASIYNHGLKLFVNNSVYNIILLIILQDFCYYWSHRAMHRIRWMWSSHVTHHSSTKLNFSTAFRQSMTYPISGMWLFYIPIAYLGFNVDMIMLIVGLNLAFQFFIHTQLVNKIGILEYIFNTPSHHRAHHGKNAEYIDKNYAGIFIIWDKMFGTFEPEVAKPRYGIVGQVHSYNPIVLTFHGWKEMFSDVWRDRDLRYLIKPPAWISDKRKYD